MDIKTLVNITSRAWSLIILGLLQDGVPARQAPLLAASGASRTAFLQSLDHLIGLGLVERNPGHGHPLRPEYRLTPQGTAYGKTSQAISRAVPGGSPLLRRSWTIPILAVSHRPRHFTGIKTDLPSITDRALSQTLKLLHEKRWLVRDLDAAKYPPRPLYRAVNVGLAISEAVAPSRQNATGFTRS